MLTYGYLFYIPVTLAFLLPIIITGVLKKRPLGFYLISIIICTYLNLVLKYSIFPIWLDGSQLFSSIAKCINFRLRFNNLDTYQIIGNIILTFPIGFCIPFLANITKKKNYIFTLLLSISIEFIQLVLIITLHTVDICFDLQDIVLNMLGGFLGCICFSLISKLSEKLSQRYFPKLNPRKDIFSFIITICNNYSTHKKTFYGM